MEELLIMSTFEKAIPVILRHEGGFVNNVNDRGGATNYGISLRFLQGFSDGDLNNDGHIDIEDIKNMTIDQAKIVYRAEWWDKYKYGAINDQTIATKVFDYAVNMGSSRAHKLLQSSLNAAFGLSLSVDGVLGPATFAVINAVADGDQEGKLISAYSDRVWAFYQSLIAQRPSLKVFQNGWRNRAYSISTPNSIS